MEEDSSHFKTYPRAPSTGAGKDNPSLSLATKTDPTLSTPKNSSKTWRTKRNLQRFFTEDSTTQMLIFLSTSMMAQNAPTTQMIGTVKSSMTRAKTTER